MPIFFGFVGHIIAICLLVHDFVAALNDSKGSAAEYQEVTRETSTFATSTSRSRSIIKIPCFHAQAQCVEQPTPSPPDPNQSRAMAQFSMPTWTETSCGPKAASRFQALPSSHKWKLTCTELEEDDLSPFKRIRLVSKEKRKKPGPFSRFSVGSSAFDAGQ
ncbi:hypothetical protein WAI453_009137 [Rhynchosporium graminicola]